MDFRVGKEGFYCQYTEEDAFETSLRVNHSMHHGENNNRVVIKFPVSLPLFLAASLSPRSIPRLAPERPSQDLRLSLL